MKLYLKRQFKNGSINTVVKLTDKHEIEIGGGEIMTQDINNHENFFYALEQLKKRDFVECDQKEYDQKARIVLKEITDII